MSSAVVPINVTDSDVDRVRLVLAETTSISGAIVLDGSARASLSGLHVKLVRSGAEFDRRIDARPGPDGGFTLEHVAPLADYDVAVENLPPGAYVKSISSAGRNILMGKSRLIPGQPLPIVLGIAADALDVRVTNGSDPAAGVQVVLIPEPSLRRRADRYVTGFTGETGDLRLVAPPGEYTAYAFEQIEPGAYYVFAFDPAAGNRFKDRGVSVTVGENGTKAIQLKVIPAAETAGALQ